MSKETTNPISKLFQSSNFSFKENKKETPSSEDGHLIVDMIEKDNSYIITAPAAGVSPEDIEIELNDDYIIIKGNRQSHSVSASHDYIVQECYWGSFSRQIDFPESTISEDATATFKDGMLHVTVPKSKSTKTRTLKIKTI